MVLGVTSELNQGSARGGRNGYWEGNLVCLLQHVNFFMFYSVSFLKP